MLRRRGMAQDKNKSAASVVCHHECLLSLMLMPKSNGLTRLQIIQQGRREAERALLNLHSSLLQAVPGIKAEPEEAGLGPESNPYLAQPVVQVHEAHIVPPQGAGSSQAGPSSQAGTALGDTSDGMARSAYEPDAAVRAFAAVLPRSLVGGETKTGHGRQGGDGQGGLDIEEGDLMGPEELSWRPASHLDSKGE